MNIYDTCVICMKMSEFGTISNLKSLFWIYETFFFGFLFSLTQYSQNTYVCIYMYVCMYV